MAYVVLIMITVQGSEVFALRPEGDFNFLNLTICACARCKELGHMLDHTPDDIHEKSIPQS